MLLDLQLIQLQGQHQKHRHAQHQHQHKGTGLDDPVGPPDVFTFPSVFCHAPLPAVCAAAMSGKEQEVTFLLLAYGPLYGVAQRKYSTSAPMPLFTLWVSWLSRLSLSA